MEIKDEVLNLDAVGFVGGLEDDEETVMSRLRGGVSGSDSSHMTWSQM